MDQEKFGKLIKEIRKKNNLTQKQFADKYNVTYQAVSKWENGLNMPDTSLIRQISKDFNISLDELFDGMYKKNNYKKRFIYVFISIFMFIIIVVLFLFVFKFLNNDNDFQFKTLSSECKNFNISGNISYNENKSAIFINKIEYCGGRDVRKYKSIECTLYESNNDVERKIGSWKSQYENITLEEFLKDIVFSVDNYENTCKEYKENSLYLSINANDFNDTVISYKVPLKLDNCNSSSKLN